MSNWRPDLYSLRLFVAVCQEGSISRAAERESIVASAISKRISEIESQAGVRLFNRGGRNLVLTAAGKALFHHARQMMRTSEKLQAELSEYAHGVSGHVRLVANMSSIVEFLPADLSTFLRSHASLRVELQERVSTAVIKAVKDEQYDFGICLGDVDLSGLESRPYEHDHLVAVYSAAHELALKSALSFDDLLAYDFVGLSDDSRMTALLSGVAARKGRALNYRMHVASFDVAFHIVAENLAVCVAPHHAVQHIGKRLGLQWTALGEDWAKRSIVLCMRQFDSLSLPAKSLIEHLQTRAIHRQHAATTPALTP